MKKQKTDLELKTIAKDLYNGRIFSTIHLSKPEDAIRVFIPLGWIGKKGIQELIDKGAYFIYEYVEKAMPVAYNSMPMFLSVQYLTKDEYDKVVDYHNKIKKAMEAI